MFRTKLQETYELKDVCFYDNARTGQKNTDWTKSSDSLTVTTADDGTTVSSTSNNEYLTDTSFTGDFKATLKTYVTGNVVRIALKDENGNYTRIVSVTNDRTVYYEITRINGVYSAKYSYDGVTWTNGSFELNNATGTVKFSISIRFSSGSSGTRAVKYSDLIIEPI